MTSLEFLQYLNLALKQSDLSESKQNEIWIAAKALLDTKTLNEIQDALTKI